MGPVRTPSARRRSALGRSQSCWYTGSCLRIGRSCLVPSIDVGVSSIRCPLVAGLSVHKTGGDCHPEERNEENNDEQGFRDSIRC
jgi:hypothetical protein